MTLFTKLQQKSTLLFLQAYPTLEAAQAATQEQLGTLLKQAGHPTADKVAAPIREAVRQPQLRADPIIIKTKSRLMLALVAQLLPLLEQLTAHDKEIPDRFLTHADSQIFESLPGAGQRLAPRLLAEWGNDRSLYADFDFFFRGLDIEVLFLAIDRNDRVALLFKRLALPFDVMKLSISIRMRDPFDVLFIGT